MKFPVPRHVVEEPDAVEAAEPDVAESHTAAERLLADVWPTSPISNMCP
jgi:hypothetical protein